MSDVEKYQSDLPKILVEVAEQAGQEANTPHTRQVLRLEELFPLLHAALRMSAERFIILQGQDDLQSAVGQHGGSIQDTQKNQQPVWSL